MESVRVSPEVVQRLTDEVARGDDWRSGFARVFGFLPVFGTLGQVLFITPAGEILFHDDPDNMLEPAGRQLSQLARAEAARTHPELGYLMPVRPSGAASCGQCEGRGIVPHVDPNTGKTHKIYCNLCSSLGWVVPDPEEPHPTPEPSAGE